MKASKHGFAAGHYLRNYKGKVPEPARPQVRVTLAGCELDHAGLLLDFNP